MSGRTSLFGYGATGNRVGRAAPSRSGNSRWPARSGRTFGPSAAGPVNCGSHSFQAKAYPITINSTGTIDRCQTSGTKTVTTSFSQSCPTASISCSRPVNTHILNCQGTGSGGSGGPYTYHWQLYAQPYNEPSYYSSWYASSSSTTSITCPYHNWDPPYDLGRLSLKVSDSSGLTSAVVTGEGFPCIAGML